MVNYASLMAEVGFTVSKKELSHEVKKKKLPDKDGRQTTFKNNFLQDDWYRDTLNKYPEMAMRKSEESDCFRGYYKCVVCLTI